MKSSIFSRICISLIACILPIIFLRKGIYGSFLFTFSIPLLWQIGFRGNSIASLGLKGNRIPASILAGLISGCIVGFLGGNILRLIGITGYSFKELHKLQWIFAGFKVTFPLAHELGYQLLNRSHTWIGLGVYLVFCILIIGLGEELFWRGFIQKKIARYLSTEVSIWLTAIAFALIHFYVFQIIPYKIGILFLVLVALAGALWGYLFEHFHNLWPAAISHGLVAFIIWKYYFFA